MSWLLAILGIAVLIITHEIGHFLAAKATGMRVEKFSLFFPPRLFGFRRGETEYMLGALPLGGYVKITGMSEEELKDLPPEVAARAYCNQAPWKRVVVILAGPVTNILTAFLLFWIVLVSGSLDGTTTLASLNPSLHPLTPTLTVQAVQKASPAAAALRPGDRIVAVNGQHVSVEGARRLVNTDRCAGKLVNGCHAAKPVTLTLARHGRVVNAVVYPAYSKELQRMLVGFDFGVAVHNYNVFSGAVMTARELGATTASLLTGLVHAFTSSKVRHEVSSIVGITQVTQVAVSNGWGFAFIVLGFVSLALAVINLFPFLPLDGGHIAWTIAEKVRGHKISLMTMMRFSSVGLVLLAFLVINGLLNDISRIAS